MPYFGVYRVMPSGKLRYVGRSATASEKLAREIAADLSDGIVVLPTGQQRVVKAYPHIAKQIGDELLPAERVATVRKAMEG